MRIDAGQKGQFVDPSPNSNVWWELDVDSIAGGCRLVSHAHVTIARLIVALHADADRRRRKDMGKHITPAFDGHPRVIAQRR